jgi:hypothetical protein
MPQNNHHTTISAQNTEKRGDKVRVRVFGGQVIERIVWDAEEYVLYLCSPRTYESLLADDPSYQPVGFPRDSIIQDRHA